MRISTAPLFLPHGGIAPFLKTQMRTNIILLSTALVVFVQSTRAQYDDELLLPKGPPLPDTRHFLDSIFLQQTRQASKRFLAQTRFTPSLGEFAGFYVSPHPISSVLRLRGDTSVDWPFYEDWENALNHRKCRLDGATMTILPDSSFEPTSILEELTGPKNATATTFEFHRVDTAVFLVHSSVLSDFAEYFFTARKGEIWDQKFFQLVLIKYDPSQMDNSHLSNSDADMDMFGAIYVFLFIVFWFGGAIYAILTLRGIAKSVTRIEEKLDASSQNETAQPPGQ